MSELLQLIEQEIPEGRQNLQENFKNLEQVAQYCQETYMQAKDKKRALEETKNYTTHSLASVAYQINNLATNFLKLLDLQQNQLAEMESNVNHLSQCVNIHKEKVARREIGVLTTNKSTTRPVGVKNGIIFPEHGERPTKYQRKNIDYTALDDIGHGVKVPDAPGLMKTPGQPQQRTHRQNSTSSNESSQAPSQQPPPTPPMGSLGRAAGQQIQGHYRTPAPMVAPPTVPNEYNTGQQVIQGGGSSMHNSKGYAPGSGQAQYTAGPSPMVGFIRTPPGMMAGQGVPGMAMGSGGQMGQQLPTGVARPMSQNTMPPPPPPPNMMGDRSSQIRQPSVDDAMPPPPPDDSPLRDSQNVSFDEASPPPPPPPPPQFDDEDEGEMISPDQEEDPYAATGPEMFMIPVPEHYIEKVIAIYDYVADKEDELSFTENSVIYVVKKNDDGWYEGVLNGVTGLFPGNYVEGCL